jgi:OCT family organic cation transporter-like MFS transporter 4/5
MPPPSKLLNDDGARDHEDRAQTFTIDSFLANVAGEFGPYQVKHYAIVGSAWISVAVATLSMVLTGQAPRWRSERDGYNATHTEAPACDNVNFQESLEPFDFVRPWESTTAEWALVCDRANFAALLGTLFFIGFGIGAFGLGSVADRIGRLPTCKLAACIAAVGALASAAAQTAQIYALCRLVAGVGAGGLSTSAYVLATELVGPSWQGVCGVGLSGIFSFGGLLLAPCSLLFPSWRGLTLCTAVPPVVNLLLFLHFVDESPRWLHANGHSERAAIVLHAVARGNGVDCSRPPTLEAAADGSAQEQSARSGTSTSDAAAAPGGTPPLAVPSSLAGHCKPRPTVAALFAGPLLRTRTLGMIYCWFASSFGYYGLSLNTGNLAGSLIVNFAFGSAIELPSYAVAVWLLGTYGRRPTLALGFGIGGLSCLACLVLPSGLPTTAAAMVGKFFVTAAFGSIFVYAGELFPTVLRSAAVGLCSTAARVGGATAPLAVSLSTIASWVPLAVFGGASLLASLVIVVLMPETLGRPLTETIEDFERAASEDHQSGGRRPGRDGRSRGGPRRETADASENATLAQEVL